MLGLLFLCGLLALRAHGEVSRVPVEDYGDIAEAVDSLRLLQEGMVTHKNRDAAKSHFRPHARLQPEGHPEATGLLQKEKQEPLTEVSHESWFSRLGNAFWSVLAGLVMMPFSLALMWMNERRNAQQESILQLGKSEAQTISSKSVDEKLHGTLVHLNDADAKGMDEVQDRRFPAMRLASGCLRLKTQVQVYQWKETKKEEKKKDSLGGGETKVTKYEYHKAWSETQIDSTSFHQTSHHNTISVPGLQCGTEEKTNPTVKLGDSHFMPQELVQQLYDFKDANDFLKVLEFNGCRFEQAEGWFHYPAAASEAPSVGAVRVSFSYVKDGPVSVLALQSEDKLHPNAATFLPYRLVYRGLCGNMSEDSLREALLTQGRKDGDELFKEEACTTGPLACLCCCCNLISMCFAKLAPPQVFAAFAGHQGKDECFEDLARFGLALKWGLRVVSWVLLYAGTYALFQPLLVVLDIVPFLGPWISSGAGWVIGLVVFLATALLATLVISIAFLIYHPLLGLAYLAGAGLIVGATLALSHALGA